MARAAIRAGVTGVALALALGLAVAGRAEALQPLSENAYVTDRLVAARVADRIRTTCPTISARLFYAFAQARALEGYALDQGYERAEIKAFLKDRKARRAVYRAAETYLAAEGAVAGDAESFCRLGRAEIAAQSLIGSLIRAQ